MNSHSTKIALGRAVAVLGLFLSFPSTGQCETLDELIFSHQFGGTGSGLGFFDAPSSVAIGPDDQIVVVDAHNHRIQVCSEDGSCFAIGSRGSEPGKFYVPSGVDVDPDGTIAVADALNGRVQLCGMEGECEYLVDSSGDPAEFEEPLDVAFGSNDRLIVTDYEKRGYFVCVRNGDCSFFPGPYGFLTIDLWDRILIMHQNDVLYSCGYSGACELLFENLSPDAPTPSFHMAHDITTDENGRVFIPEQAVGRIQLCEPDGACNAFEIHRPVPQLMWWPAAVALTSEGELVVVDREGDRIHFYELIEFEGPAIPINTGMTDAWYDPATAGQGIFLNAYVDQPQFMFAAWFTFDIEIPLHSSPSGLGDSQQRWLTAQGIVHTYSATLTIYTTSGLTFLDGSVEPATESIGEMIIRFESCARGRVHFAIPLLGRSGEFPIQRLTRDGENLCRELLEAPAS